MDSKDPSVMLFNPKKDLFNSPNKSKSPKKRQKSISRVPNNNDGISITYENDVNDSSLLVQKSNPRTKEQMVDINKVEPTIVHKVQAKLVEDGVITRV